MKKNPYDYPIPILSTDADDYTDSRFESAMEATESKDLIKVSLTVTLTSEGLIELLKQKKIAVVFTIESSSTSYRRAISAYDISKPIIISIEKALVRDKVELGCNLVSVSDIDDFYVTDFNPDYFSGTKFKVRKGDILAYEEKHIIRLESSELEAPITSIFTITNIGQQSDPAILPEFDDDKIVIGLDEETYTVYDNFRQTNPASRRYLSAVIVLPVLTEAIDRIIGEYQKNIEDGEEGDVTLTLRWQKAIIKKCREKGIELIDQNGSVTIAAILLGDIVNDALKTLRDLIENEFDGVAYMMGGDD